MRKYGIADTSWKLLAETIGIDVEKKFNAYGLYECEDLKISRCDHWCGWWNECYDFVDIFPKTKRGEELIQKVIRVFSEEGYRIDKAIRGGIGISYDTMTKEESEQKAYSNLMHGGRMSD